MILVLRRWSEQEWTRGVTVNRKKRKMLIAVSQLCAGCQNVLDNN